MPRKYTKTQYRNIVIVAAVVAIALSLLLFFQKAPRPESVNGPGRAEVSAADMGVDEIKTITASDFTETFSSKKYKFSFKYPSDYTVSTFPDETTGGDLVLMQKKGGKSGVQITISPFDEDGSTLTADRIENEAGIEVSDPQEVLLGESGKGVAFVGSDTDFGTSREVWFVFKGNLYQISTYIELDELVKNVLDTWKFE